jgi:predicted nucleotidyltransferase
MKSIKELLDEYRQALNKYIYVCDHDMPFIVDFGKEVDLVEAEILSRFEELEKEKDFLDLCFKQKNKDLLNAESAYADLEQRYMNLKQRAEQAEEQVERLKCCGNCKFIDGIYCNQDDRGQVFIHNYQYCSNWQSDNLTRKERET